MNYWIFLLPIIALILTQLIKVVIELFSGNFSWHVFKKYGGMPSSHSALVFALLTEVIYIDGIYSTTFAIALILTILIIRDATGYRRNMDCHSQLINSLVKELPSEKQPDLPHLDDTIGHTPLQAAVGAVVGILTVVIGNLLF